MELPPPTPTMKSAPEIANRRNGTFNGFVRRVILDLKKCFVIDAAVAKPFLEVCEHGTVLVQIFARYYKTEFSEFGITVISCNYPSPETRRTGI